MAPNLGEDNRCQVHPNSSPIKLKNNFLHDEKKICENSNGLWESVQLETSERLQQDYFEVSWQKLVYSIVQNQTQGGRFLSQIKRVRAGVCESLNKLACHSTGTYDIQKVVAKDEYLGELEARRAENKVEILQNLNGSFRSGELTGIMGPSGAGKTSLMNILSRRLKTDFSGKLSVKWVKQGAEVKLNKKLKIIAIPQDDQLNETLTVRENLMYATRLKNGPAALHAKLVSRVSGELGLDDCLDTRTCKISGGQRKRLSIAQELLSRPDIMILDEPTSGLDSGACLRLLSVLRALVKSSHTDSQLDPIAIVLTIHQPQSEAFNLFDSVYIMATGGRAIYNGPPAQCLEFVEKNTRLSLPSVDFNPASFIIDIASVEFGEEPVKKLEKQIRIEFDKGSPNEKFDANERLIDKRLVRACDLPSEQFLYRTDILTRRIWYTMSKDKPMLAFRLITYFFVPISLAAIFGRRTGAGHGCPKYRKEYDLSKLVSSEEYISKVDTDGIMFALENLSLLFMSLNICHHISIGFANLFCSLDLISSLKEYYNGWYSMNSYVISRIISALPTDILFPATHVVLVYILTGQATSGSLSLIGRISLTSISLMMSCMVCGLWGIALSLSYKKHLATGIFISQGLLLPSVILSGFCLRTNKMHPIVNRLSNFLSFHRHVFDISFIARYGWNTCECKPGDVSPSGPIITGVPERLQEFMKFQQTMNDPSSANSSEVDADFFQLLAKQISSYNCYGAEVSSCKDMVPYLLTDLHLTDENYIQSFVFLATIMIVSLLLTLQVARLSVTTKSAVRE